MRPIDITKLTSRDALVTDKRVSLDANNNLINTKQPDNSAIGTAASKDHGTAANQVPLNEVDSARIARSIANYQAIRDYTGTEETIYAKGQAADGDGGESFFQKKTGAASGFYVDDNNQVITPTGGDGSVGWVRSLVSMLSYDTLALAAASPQLSAGSVVSIKGRLSATGRGASVWDVVFTSAVTPNALNIVAGTAIATLSLVLRMGTTVSASQFGLVNGGVTDNSASFVILCSVFKGDFIFDDGIYGFSNAYVVGASDLVLTCKNNSKIKRLDGSHGTNPDSAISGIIDFLSCSNIQLVDMEIDCNKSGATPSGGTHLNGINFYLCDNVVSYHNHIYNAEFQGLNHQNCNNVRARSNIITGCGWTGIGVTGGYFALYGAEYAYIIGNTFEDTWAGVQSQISMRYLYVEDNIFIRSSLILAQDVVYGTIARNTFDGVPPSGALGEVPQDAIFMESDSNITVDGNIINAPARFGIQIQGNYMPNGPLEGVMVCDNIKVINNTLNNCPQGGISFAAGSPYTYNAATHTPTLEADQSLWTRGKGGQIKGNTVLASGGVGISASIIEDTYIAGNSSSLNLLSGMLIGHSKKTDVTHNNVYNNSKAGADLHDGIQVESTAALVDFLSIHHNRIYDNQSVRTQRYGVNNQVVASTDFKMWANTLERNGTDYISVVDYLPFSIISPTLLNGASNFGGGLQDVNFYRDDNSNVCLRGVALLGAGTVGSNIFVLPENYRPKLGHIFNCISNGAISRVDVNSDGSVFVSTGSNSQYLSLSGIVFAIGG